MKKTLFGVLLGCAALAIARSIPSAYDEFKAVARAAGLSDADILDLGGQLGATKDDNKNLLASLTCRTAHRALGTDVVDTAPVSQEVAFENWSATCHATPRCIIRPKTTQHVSTAMKIISGLKSSFATRSGGHSPNPRASSINDTGVLLDLQRLSAVSVSPDKRFATVGAGARWGHVYAVLDEAQTIVIGARLPQVGVGGSILGGGYFHISGLYGLASDNVKNFEAVLADGSIVNANAHSNSDLFWALKGGGPNFGILTQLELYTVPTYLVWGQISVHSTDQASEIIEAFDEWQRNGASDAKSTVALSIGLDAITVGLTYADPVSEPPEAFQPFYNIEPLQVAVPPTNLTFNLVNQIVGAGDPTDPSRHDYRGISTKIDTELTKKMYAFWRDRALAIREATGASQGFSIQHVGPNLVEEGRRKGGNPLNIPLGKQQWWTTLVNWDNAADDDLVRSVSIDTTNQWQKLAKARGTFIPFLFMNDASRDQDPLAFYGAANLARLRNIANKFDRNQVFQRQQNGGFLLSQAAGG
ncbi:hypothetical protein FZEAL_10248 [Fusarium zealandicum]|uniref:FAD-binding PCMH-type domain-containing protein n=1 Tax=Fusarium zealandicum TaxID=1053134 RepID=A0A8H4XBS5_9HYPO|nr:hypothetical protein FZEAL_10248 [Fusarium zealandicum]